ncbi:Nucleolar protein 4 [Habropoda laboriosa]|uniref:Nucleolar protein 4 n=1 Tax=Habropoda laboriosa TaxID=597456 RepID=A0A0L7R278_9HYME|nr:Nucleolar protein 4 [Habropoda laboriosa]
MASATMGLRRRVPVNNSPTPSSQSASSSGSSSKRSRSENNNSPSHGNLNSMNGPRDEPPTKKSRGTSTNASKNSSPETSPSSKSRGGSVSRSAAHNKASAASAAEAMSNNWPTSTNMSDVSTYASVAGLSMAANPNAAGLCAGSLSMPSPIPYMSSSMATFVGNATNLGKSSAVSYLDISNMTGGSLSSATSAGMNSGYVGNGNAGNAMDTKNGVPMPFPGIAGGVNGAAYGLQKGQTDSAGLPKKFQNDGMFNAYQPWVIKTYGDLAKTKTITIKKYARILRTLRGEEVNSAENSKFRFWVKSKGFHIGQPEGYDAKPADRIIGRHAVTSPGLDPPLYVPTQLPHNKPAVIYKDISHHLNRRISAGSRGSERTSDSGKGKRDCVKSSAERSRDRNPLSALGRGLRGMVCRGRHCEISIDYGETGNVALVDWDGLTRIGYVCDDNVNDVELTSESCSVVLHCAENDGFQCVFLLDCAAEVSGSKRTRGSRVQRFLFLVRQMNIGNELLTIPRESWVRNELTEGSGVCSLDEKFSKRGRPRRANGGDDDDGKREKQSVGTRAAEEAAREERERIDAMDLEVGWAGVERMNGWMDSAMKPLKRKHAYCRDGRCRAFYIFHAVPDVFSNSAQTLPQ